MSISVLRQQLVRGTNDGNATSYSTTYNNPEGTNFMVVFANTHNINITACTYNGVAMTLQEHAKGDGGNLDARGWMWTMADPPEGDNTLAFTHTENRIGVIAYSLSGVSGITNTNSVGGNHTDDNPNTLNVLSIEDGLVIDHVRWRNSNSTGSSGTGQTVINDDTPTRQLSSYKNGEVTSTDMVYEGSETGTSSTFCHLAISLEGEVQVGASATINIVSESEQAKSVDSGSSSTINILSEGVGVKGVLIGSSATINVSSEATTTKGVDKDSELTITIQSEASKVKDVLVGASVTINIVSEGTKAKSTDVGSSAVTNITSEGASTKDINKGSESTVNILSEGERVKSVSVGSESIINVSAEGAGTPEEPPIQKGAESIINVSAESDAIKNVNKDSEASISISAEVSGVKITGVSSEALIEIIAEALGEKSVNQDSQALIDILSEGNKTKDVLIGSNSTIVISAEGVITIKELVQKGANAFINIMSGGAAMKSVDIVGINIGSSGKQLVIKITATGGDGSYEYSIDNVNWQVSNTFSGLVEDTYTVYVRDGQTVPFTDSFEVVLGGLIQYIYYQRGFSSGVMINKLSASIK